MRNVKWILCPVCGNKTHNRIREDTVLKNYPLYCPKCKQETLIEVTNLRMTVIVEPAAKVVKKIFDLCISGLGSTQIAKCLKADEIMMPTEYWNSIGRKCSKPPERPFKWCADTISNIFDKQEYCSDTINFRTTSKSFKLKKRFERLQKK